LALAGRGAGGVLSLLGLLLALSSGLLLLGVLDGLLAGGGTSLGALASSLLDHIERSTDDGTLGLDDTASTLLGDFLWFNSVSIGHPMTLPHMSREYIKFHNVPRWTSNMTQQRKNRATDLRDTLAVLATIKDGPRYPARVLALEEKGLRLSILEAEDLAVATDVQLTLL
jgi:hypothetical protein